MPGSERVLGSVAAVMASVSPSPTGNPLETTDTGRTLFFLAVGGIVFLFVLAIARTLKRGWTDSGE